MVTVLPAILARFLAHIWIIPFPVTPSPTSQRPLIGFPRGGSPCFPEGTFLLPAAIGLYKSLIFWWEGLHSRPSLPSVSTLPPRALLTSRFAPSRSDCPRYNRIQDNISPHLAKPTSIFPAASPFPPTSYVWGYPELGTIHGAPGVCTRCTRRCGSV